MEVDDGLEKLGIATGKHLNIALTTSADPLTSIKEFQDDNGIDAESLKIALPFLDLHGVKRLTLHLNIFETIREKLLSRVSELSTLRDEDSVKKLETLLDNSFPAIRNKELRPVVMTIMKHLPKVKDEYLKILLENKELYQELATEVKRQIWEHNQALFGDEVQPLLAQYIHEKEQSLYQTDNPSLSFFSQNPKQRRQRPTLQKLLHMIGSNVKLYNMVLQFLLTLFLRTRNTHYCTLRVELLMAVHDLELNSICSKDPCHKFTWCVDACIREKTVNSLRAKELQGFLDSVKKGQEFVLGDLSIVLSDPFAINIILQSVMKILQSCITTDTLPRDQPDLQLLCRMVSLGLSAWEMNDSGNFREPRIDQSFFTKFLPYIVGLMTHDQIRFFTSKIPGDIVHTPTLPPDMYADWISKNALAGMVAIYYTLQSARMKDRLSVVQMLPTLIHCESDRVYNNTYLHCLVSYLIHAKDEFQDPLLVTAVMDDFFLPAVSRENVLRHLLRLLTHVHHRMPRDLLDRIMQEIHSEKDLSPSVQQILVDLQDKIVNYVPSPEPSIEQIDSPLMSVPAPTPAPHR